MMRQIITILMAAVMALTTFTCAPAEAKAKTIEYDTDELIVVFNDDMTEAEAEDVTDGQVEMLDLSDDDIIEEGEPVLVQFDEKVDIEKFESNPDVAYVQPNYHYSVDGMSAKAVLNEKAASKMWYFDYMDVPEAWKLIERIKEEVGPGERVKVATIDTGCASNLRDINVNFDAEHSIKVAGDEPELGKVTWAHGTGTVSVIGATSNNNYGFSGMASGINNDLVSVSSINVFGDTEWKDQRSATTADTIKGIRYATEYGAQAINMSMGYTTEFVDANGNLHDDQALEDEINRAVYECGIPVICSAGNWNSTMYWAPADFDATISVVGIKKYSNAWANAKYRMSNYGPNKTIGGAGEGVYKYTLAGKMASANATSWATATVTSVAALMLYVNPNLSPDEVREILCDTATDVYLEGKDDYTGYGLANAYSAVGESVYRAIEAGTLNISREEFDEIIKETSPAESEGRILLTPEITSIKSKSKGIKLTWNSKATSVCRINIYRADDENGEFECVKTLRTTAHSWTDRRARKGHTYQYKVKVYKTSSDGKKVWSDYSAPIEVVRK